MNQNEGFVCSGELGLTRRQLITTGIGATVGASMYGCATGARPIASERESSGLAPGVTYFNHASLGTCPESVVRKQIEMIRHRETNPWRYMHGHGWDDEKQAYREAMCRSLGCTDEMFTCTHTTQEACHILASGLPLGPDDEVLFSSINHFSCDQCWHRWGALRGYSVREFEFPIERAPELTEKEIVDLHIDQIGPRTSVLVLPHVDYLLGLRHPIEAITRDAKRRGVRYVVVDGAQIHGMLPVDVRALGVDAYVGSSHKWMQTPKGVGYLVTRPELHFEMARMWTLGPIEHGSDLEVNTTRDFACWFSSVEAVRLRETYGYERAERVLCDLRDHAYERVRPNGRLRWNSPVGWELGCSIVCFEVRGVEQRDVLARMRETHGYVFRSFDRDYYRGIRLSFHVQNTHEQIDSFFDTLEREFA
ncbi:MAG: aminotransferase class V-fold PLP-dependent enzyme [Phycisphaerales bacterium JB043]